MVIVLFWDGLRPDFVRPDLTPHLCQLIDRGVNFRNHHAVFPSETRVNASSVATGCYPGTHGVVGNRIFVPSVEKHRALNTGDHEDLLAISNNQPLLSVPTLAETLKKRGKTYAIFSSGSPGSSWVQCAPDMGHMINVRGVVHPEYLRRDIETKYGPLPPESVPATSWNDLAVQLMADAIDAQTYDVVFGWLCDPDLTQHKAGLGADLSLRAIRENDNRLAKLLEVCGSADILVCSDHGFSSLAEPFDHREAFVQAGFDLDSLVWTGNGVVLREGYKDRLEAVVNFLVRQDFVGPIFTRGAEKQTNGHIAGTFSFDVPKLNHIRTPDVMFSRRWSELENEYGVPGHVFGSGGIASHGSCSPYDLHNVLVAAGPSFKKGEESVIASGVVDIAPTVQKLVFGDVQTLMDGRVLVEGLMGEVIPQRITTEVLKETLDTRRQYVQLSTVEDTCYIDKGWI
ncbi:MAG: hypothetical protein HN521_10605 [Candidatus Latescibacteria bacterium]|nr:hypothetical protein [Candidatus Latescibacterota bacterium]